MHLREDVNTPMLIAIGLLSVLFVISLVIALMAMYYQAERHELKRKAQYTEYVELREIIFQQKIQLSRYEWIDRDAGILSVPIEVAMARVVEEQSLESLISPILEEAGDALNEQPEEEGMDEAEGSES